MNFIQRNILELEQENAYFLVPFYKESNIKNQLEKLHIDCDIIEQITQKQKEPKGQTIMIPDGERIITITLMNLGYEDEFSLNHLLELFGGFGKQVTEDYQILLEGLQFKNHTIQSITESIIKSMFIGAYSFSKDKLTKAENNRLFSQREQLKDEKDAITITLISSEDLHASMDKAMNYGQCINYARILGDMPNNYLHVKQFAEYVQDFSDRYNLTCEILGRIELEELKSGGILGVNAGSKDEANLISVYYEGSKGAPITAVIGKGVMFDSGGYHIKSIGGMDGMKYDMCGAANVLSALEIAIRQKSKKNILMVIPAVENVISSEACKSGDVLTTMSGKTVEVYNTDAEGRLILCDAITYAIKKGASNIIDVATLTYSVQSALGNDITGIFSNYDGFYEEFLKKAREQGEKIWRLPLEDSYRHRMHKTTTADLINYASSSEGGAITAACFLEEFVDKSIPWIHLDIAGTAVCRNENKMQTAGATGVLVATIAAYFE